MSVRRCCVLVRNEMPFIQLVRVLIHGTLVVIVRRSKSISVLCLLLSWTERVPFSSNEMKHVWNLWVMMVQGWVFAWCARLNSHKYTLVDTCVLSRVVRIAQRWSGTHQRQTIREVFSPLSHLRFPRNGIFYCQKRQMVCLGISSCH